MFGSVGNPERIHEALAERMREILPPELFTVELDDAGLICVRATNVDGHSTDGKVLFGSSELRTLIPSTRRLKLYFESRAEGLQAFVSRALGRPWPSASARPHVQMTGSEILIWFGGEDPAQAELRLRPITQDEIRA
jgi:hypothetical protein